MLRNLLVAITLVSAPAVIMGCGSKDPNSAEEAKSDKPPQEELKGIADDLNKDIDAIIKPLNDVDQIVKDIDELPKKLGLTASDFKVMAKAAFDGGEIKVSEKVKPEQKEEVNAFLTRIKDVGTGIREAPSKLQSLGAKLPGAIAKIPLLYAKAQASLQVTANNPFGKADEKAKAKTDLAELDKIKTDMMSKIEDTKKKVTELPGKATEAGAKMGKALAS